MGTRTRHRVWSRWLVAHATVVVVCTVLFELIVWATPPEAGFNFGVVYVALPLMALGLPWNLLSFIDPYQFDGLSPWMWSLACFGPAFLNLAIHGVLFWLVTRRGTGRPQLRVSRRGSQARTSWMRASQ